METKIYNMQGKEAGTMTLPQEIFGLPWNADLIHQVVVAMQGNARHSTAHTKDRGEVRGGGRKPWQQKGTGRARHGSSRSPIWKGGGVAHGPRTAKDYSRKLNRKVRQKALLVALSRKMRDGEVTLVDSIALSAPKAATGKAFLTAFNITRRNNAALIALPATNAAVQKSFSNFGNVSVMNIRDINPVEVLGKRRILVVDPKAALEILSKKLN